MSENHFAKALHNFTMDAAAGDAIRHLTDKGYTLSQIRETLTFPAPIEYIAKIMWERLVETHKVLLNDSARVLSDRAPVAQTVLAASRLRNSLCGIPADTRAYTYQQRGAATISHESARAASRFLPGNPKSKRVTGDELRNSCVRPSCRF